MDCKLTVIVTTYNIAEYLPRFFDCMKAQTFTDYCLLVLDDGSSDNSLEICRQRAAEDERIKVIASEHIGIARIKNLSLQHIDTPLTAFVDGDDIVTPDYLRHLVDAIEKYNADLAISRVKYLREKDMVQTAETPPRGETFISEAELQDWIPTLLEERRLNYFYAKVYRSELLKPLRIEEDVKQGSDTMLVIQYMHKAKSVVLIDDLDYHYIKYGTRSITSYSGKEAFARLLRVNLYVRDHCRDHNTLTDKLNHVIDGRILLAGIWVTDKILSSDLPDDEKIAQLSGVLENEEYTASYQRQKNNFDYDFTPIPPQSGKEYYNSKLRSKKKARFRGKLAKLCPQFIIKLYHKTQNK